MLRVILCLRLTSLNQSRLISVSSSLILTLTNGKVLFLTLQMTESVDQITNGQVSESSSLANLRRHLKKLNVDARTRELVSSVTMATLRTMSSPKLSWTLTDSRLSIMAESHDGRLSSPTIRQAAKDSISMIV